jgi:uncharacterized protein
VLDVALLLIGAFAAAMISGAAGFGGALLLLPLLTRTVGIEQAVPMLTVAQLVGNMTRLGLGWRVVHWRPAGLFLATAVPAAAVGAFFFAGAQSQLIIRLAGAAILTFVLLRLTGWMKFKGRPAVLVVGGATVGLVSGLVGSAGPLGAAIFLSLGLSPLAYLATEAATAVGMHLTKMFIYQRELRLGLDFWPLALGMGAAMFAGTWVAKRVVDTMPKAVFEKIVSGLLVVVAAQMIIWP